MRAPLRTCCSCSLRGAFLFPSTSARVCWVFVLFTWASWYLRRAQSCIHRLAAAPSAALPVGTNRDCNICRCRIPQRKRVIRSATPHCALRLASAARIRKHFVLCVRRLYSSHCARRGPAFTRLNGQTLVAFSHEWQVSAAVCVELTLTENSSLNRGTVQFSNQIHKWDFSAH